MLRFGAQVKPERAEVRYMNIDENLAVTIGGGFFARAIIGYALRKLLKILAIVVGLFFAGLAYLQYQQIVNIKTRSRLLCILLLQINLLVLPQYFLTQ